ncbi:hypothetical protein GWK08_17585 [Leptobacterium flavescens]|uniref:SRPBCC family protein n=1 Tax=Leptobacterium flavescens TaxID=472055 RepID=A0A6P0UX08_9FLAO|nr:SRPBCC family protein [Leptobacterium flavescens]NER15273.1 hypothetical protein [Leptobacterium flavescens]
MKYSGSIEIEKPVELVTRLFTDPEGMKEYQDGFIKKELLSGREGNEGAISKMYYQYGKRDMILTETIVSNNLPDSFEATYHHKHMDNTFKCSLIELNENRTRYEYAYEYTRMSLIPRIMGILFPKMYRQQGEKWMKQFKEFVERQ